VLGDICRHFRDLEAAGIAASRVLPPVRCRAGVLQACEKFDQVLPLGARPDAGPARAERAHLVAQLGDGQPRRSHAALLARCRRARLLPARRTAQDLLRRPLRRPGRAVVAGGTPAAAAWPLPPRRGVGEEGRRVRAPALAAARPAPQRQP